VYVVWKVGDQRLADRLTVRSDMGGRGPFNSREKIWHMPHRGAAGLHPAPLAHITAVQACPAKNTAAHCLHDRYDDHFFIALSTGSSGGSGVYSFAVKRKGRPFEVADGHSSSGRVLATDRASLVGRRLLPSDWAMAGTHGKGRASTASRSRRAA